MSKAVQSFMHARRHFRILLGCLGVCAVFLADPAAAQFRRGPMPGFRGGAQPLDRLLPEIRRTHPGDFYDAEGPTYGPRGEPHYHLKWITPDGHVIWYDADARNGRILRSSPGRDSFDGPDPYRGAYPAPPPPPPPGAAPFPPNFRPAPGYARPFRFWPGPRGRWRR